MHGVGTEWELVGAGLGGGSFRSRDSRRTGGPDQYCNQRSAQCCLGRLRQLLVPFRASGHLLARSLEERVRVVQAIELQDRGRAERDREGDAQCGFGIDHRGRECERPRQPAR